MDYFVQLKNIKIAKFNFTEQPEIVNIFFHIKPLCFEYIEMTRSEKITTKYKRFCNKLLFITCPLHFLTDVSNS